MLRRLVVIVLLAASFVAFGGLSSTHAAPSHIDVAAPNADGTRTGLEVKQGELLTFQAVGSWCSGGIKNDGTPSCGGPEGIRPADPGEDQDLVLPSQPVGLLIGRVDSWIFPIGAETTITAQASGKLVLLMNDRACCYSDNSGSVSVSASNQEKYPVRDLGTLGGNNSQANAVNSSKQIVGWSNVTPGSDIEHAFLWRNGKMKDLGTLGGDNSEALGINDRGWVVGWSEVTPGSSVKHAVLWHNGGIVDLGTMGGANSEAHAINNRGEIVGSSETEVSLDPEQYVYGHAFRWVRGSMEALPETPCPLGDDHNRGSSANAINNDGKVAGVRWCRGLSFTSGSVLFWDSTNTATDLCSAYEACGGGEGINERAQIVFTYVGKRGPMNGYLWNPGDHTVTDIGVNSAHAINDRGMVVGRKLKMGSAYVWWKGKLLDLPSLSGNHSDALGINNQGVIVGWSSSPEGYGRAVIWRP